MKKTLVIILNLFFCIQVLGQVKTEYIATDGAWCWFSDPRAIMVDNNLITGWVKSDGTIEAAKLNLKDQKYQTCTLFNKLEKDDHNNPSFVQNKNGDIIAMYTTHSKKGMFFNTLMHSDTSFEFSSSIPINPISASELEKYPFETIAYTNPWRLKNEQNKLYCFGRWTGYKPNIMWSIDDGLNWSKSQVFITKQPYENNNRPYVKYYSDGISKIHIVFTDGHPRNESNNSVYYCYLEEGNFFRANGELICDMNSIPFEPEEASVVYESKGKEGRAWIADIGEDKKGNPVILYTKSPTEEDHRYHYARYVKKKWLDNEICGSGKWFPQTPLGEVEREPHYFGGMTIHPNNCNVVFLSRQINGVFEIERRETRNKGKKWQLLAITENSKHDNVRPYVPRGLKQDDNEIVLWMENERYVHYTDFNSAIKYSILKH